MDHPGQSEIIGAVLAVVSSIISNAGVNIQKSSHSRNASLPTYDQKAYVARPRWWFGLAMVIIGSVGDFAAFGFATQALVASLGGGTTMISNVVIAYFFNHERLYRSDLIGVMLVIIGVIWIAVLTDPDKQYSLSELEHRFLKPGFLVYISIVIVSALSVLATIKGSLANKVRNQLRFSRQRQKRLILNYELRFQQLENRMDELERVQELKAKHRFGKTDGEEAEEPLAVVKKKQKQEHKLKQVDDIMDGIASRDHVPYYYAICAGVVGAISVLLAKISALLIRRAIHGGANELFHSETYIFFGGMVITILIQTHLLNMATSLGDTMTVYPMFQAFWISFSVIGGIVFYETEKEFTTAKWICYPLALTIVSVGIIFLLQHEAKKRLADRAAKTNATRNKNLRINSSLSDEEEYDSHDEDDQLYAALETQLLRSSKKKRRRLKLFS